MSDDHDSTPDACKIEDWRWYRLGSYIVVEGATTCAAGELHLRLYDDSGANRKFLGVSTTYIEGHIFRTMVDKIKKKKSIDLSIEYVITKENTENDEEEFPF